ncbi:uncharacterized protein BYT42DRAFT_618810 [Radiomyces spectabilis]|uniref:uncharacterized protein n=1 Tax=Radiomyces spectabilis TaxID=64574 RepID=UPI00222022BA|nr:uncharacterized protein BYT42DRAFT_618810 [Radiomyces spectabilis]KAI8364653.1 hypothetical protein BYT42DRAFT_618810 [Radiomyces spectabilis]
MIRSLNTLLLMLGVFVALSHAQAATIGCAAEANFQACKSIQESQLRSCGTADYTCQCAAQKLIQQCYNLCPAYSNDANMQAGTVNSICSAIPTTSIALPSVSPVSIIPQPSSAAPQPSPSVSVAPASNQSSAATTISPMASIKQIVALGTLLLAVLYSTF